MTNPLKISLQDGGNPFSGTLWIWCSINYEFISLSVCPEKHSTWGTCVLLLPHKLTVGRDLQQAPEVTRYVVTGSFGAAASFCLILLDLHRILFTQGQLSSQTAWVQILASPFSV